MEQRPFRYCCTGCAAGWRLPKRNQLLEQASKNLLFLEEASRKLHGSTNRRFTGISTARCRYLPSRLTPFLHAVLQAQD